MKFTAIKLLALAAMAFFLLHPKVTTQGDVALTVGVPTVAYAQFRNRPGSRPRARPPARRPARRPARPARPVNRPRPARPARPNRPNRPARPNRPTKPGYRPGRPGVRPPPGRPGSRPPGARPPHRHPRRRGGYYRGGRWYAYPHWRPGLRFIVTLPAAGCVVSFSRGYKAFRCGAVWYRPYWHNGATVYVRL